MQRLTKFALRHVLSLAICLLSFGGTCFAQEVDVPGGRGSGSLVAPTGWAELIAPVHQRIDLKFYGFYIGELKAPSAQFDATFRAPRFFPTYTYAGKSLPEKEINRYRNRIAVAYPLAVGGHIWKPFASYEAFYDQGSGWTKNRAWTGVTVPIEKHVSFQPSYMWESTNGIKDLHYVMFGLIFKLPSR